MTATNAVFQTPELLLLIFSHLTPLEILKAQRISPVFHALINTSHKIQTTLGFRPLTTAPPLTTPQPTALFSLLFSIFHYNIDDNVDGSGVRGLVRPSCPPHGSTCHPDKTCDPRVHEPFLRKEASWRRVLSHDPPVARLEMLIDHDSDGSAGQQTIFLGSDDFSDGLRLGALYDVTLSPLLEKRWHYADFRIDVVPGCSTRGMLRPLQRTDARRRTIEAYWESIRRGGSWAVEAKKKREVIVADEWTMHVSIALAPRRRCRHRRWKPGLSLRGWKNGVFRMLEVTISSRYTRWDPVEECWVP